MRSRALRRALGAFAALALAFGFGPAQAAEDAPWQAVLGHDKGYGAEMPGAPKYSTTRLKASGTSYTLHQYLFERGQQAFIVQSATYPRDVNVSDPQAALQIGLTNTAKRMEGGKWASVDWMKHDGSLMAVDASGSREGQDVRSYQVLKGRQVFTLIYAGPPGTSRSDEASRFLGSLKIAPELASSAGARKP